MNKTTTITRALVFVAMIVAGTAFGSGTNAWDSTVAPGGNTPATAYNWSDQNNWSTKTYVPTGFGDGATLGSATTAPRFIRLPALGTFGLTHIGWGDDNHLLGDFVFGDDPTGKFAARQSIAIGANSILYGDFYMNNIKGYPYAARFNIAGRFMRSDENPLGRSKVYADWGRTDQISIRMDLFAESPNPVRAAPFLDDGPNNGNGSFLFVGPRGAPAQSGTWSQTAGSTYLNKVSMDGTVVPGSVVTGNGIPSGTFVKYVFSTTGWIELSKAATTTIAENPLAFGAITPSVEQVFNKEGGGTTTFNGIYLRAVKYREEDGCRVIYKSVGGTGPNAKKRNWGLSDDDIAAGYIPGDIVISNMTTTASNCLCNVVRLELPNVLDSSPWYLNSDCNARLTVPEGRTGGFAKFHGEKGLIEKRGSGTLSLGFEASAMPGTIKVDEGAVAVTETASIAAGSIELGRLELAAGTTLKLPSNGMSVSNLVAGAGSFIEGPGTLTVINWVEGVPSLTGGARVSFAIPAPSASDAFPASDRWLHFDASAASTITTNAIGEVTKWDDVDGTGEYATAPMYANTDDTAKKRPSGCPTVRVNAINSLPMVDLGEISFTNVSPGVSSVATRALKFVKASGESYSDPAASVGSSPNIKTAFFVVGSEYGGGPLLGTSGNNFWNYGMPHAPSADFTTPIVGGLPNYNSSAISQFGAGNINDGTTVFRTNGVSIYPREVPFSGGFDVISYANSTGRKSNGLGFCGNAYSSVFPLVANGLLYGEVVLFTNRLSLAQIQDAEAYLARKWFGRETPHYYKEMCDAFSVAAGSTLAVTGGGLIETSGIGGGGTVEGNVALDEAAVFNVALDGATVPTLTVTGNVSLPKKATVVVSGSLSGVALGSYPILSAGAIAGSVREWDVVSGKGRRHCVVSTEGDSIVLTVIPDGMFLIFR